MTDPIARALREHATEAERRLWLALRDRRLGGCKFRRQYRIGPYIADFACTRVRLVVEADGGQHAADGADRARNRFMENRGWRVIRFWNNEILDNTEGVVEMILAALAERPLTPTLSPGGGEGVQLSALAPTGGEGWVRGRRWSRFP